MWNQSTDFSQNRKKQTKKAISIQDCPTQRASGSNHAGPSLSLAAGAARSEDAEAMEDPLDVGDVAGEFRAALHFEIPRPWQIDVDHAIDAPGSRRDHADPARKLHRLLDGMGDEDDGRPL